jgi:hypothetical protein
VLRSWHVVRLEGAPLSDAAESLRRYIVEVGGDFIAKQFVGLDQQARSH